MKEEDEEEDELDLLIKKLGGCAQEYWNFDLCLDQNKKSFSICQKEIKLLKDCWLKQENIGNRTVQKDRLIQFELEQYKKLKKKKEL
jgi:hypothetical protein